MSSIARMRSAFAAVALVLLPLPAHAAWSPDGNTIKATTVSIPRVSACSDGASGSFVVWMEAGTPGGGSLYAQHVLSAGDLDPAWPPAGALAGNLAVTPAEIGVLPDRLGGLYVWRLEERTFTVQRLDSNGLVADGWPANGRQLGNVYPDSPSPCVIEDGAHGLYAAWSQGDAGAPLVIHLGPGNTGAGGWPGHAINVAPELAGTAPAYWPRLALASDGGVFAAFAVWSADTTLAPSAYRLRRLTSAGGSAPGWTSEGLTIAPFDRTQLGEGATSSNLAISPDDRGGVFVLLGEAAGVPDPFPPLTPRVYRLQGDGVSAADWPAEGKIVGSVGFHLYWDGGADASYSIVPDGVDGALAGTTEMFADAPLQYVYYQLPASGPMLWSSIASGTALGHEAAPRVGGGLCFADFKATGPYSSWDGYAYLGLQGWSRATGHWGGTMEWHPESVVQWYGDIGLAATEDGGSLFYWSQARERFGLFGRLYSPAGEIVGVAPPPPPAFTLQGLRFVPGAGIRARITVPDGSPVRIDVYDLAGRRLAGERLDALHGSKELTITGTTSLASGIYFTRVTAGPGTIARRVVVRR